MHAHALLIGLQFIDVPNEQEEEMVWVLTSAFCISCGTGALECAFEFLEDA